MRHPLKHYAIAFYDALHADDASEPSVIKRFVRLLARDGVLHKASTIIEYFKKHWNMQEQSVDVYVTTAQTITEAMKKNIAATIIDGKKEQQALVHATVDPRVLGGAVIQIGDTVFDGSVRRQLATMKHKLAS